MNNETQTSSRAPVVRDALWGIGALVVGVPLFGGALAVGIGWLGLAVRFAARCWGIDL